MTFAKIVIASDGEQVLFFKDNGDEGPELVHMTVESGITARLGMGFDDDEVRDAAFEKADVEQANMVRKLVKEATP